MTEKKEKDFIKKLKLAMLESGFNQVSLAKKIGIKSNSVSQWLTGKNNPKLSTLEKVAKATGKSVNYFFDNSPVGDGNNIVHGSHNQTACKDTVSLEKEIELLKAKQEAQHLAIANLALRLEKLEHKK